MRDLGLTTSLKKGVIHLEKPHTVCNEGDTLNADQVALLRLLENEMAEFKITVEAMWSEKTGCVDITEREPLTKKQKNALRLRSQAKGIKAVSKKKDKTNAKNKPARAEPEVEMESEPDEEVEDEELEEN